MCVNDIKHYKITPEPHTCAHAAGCVYPCGNLPRVCNRCWRCRFCSAAACKGRRPFAVGTRSSVAQRSRRPLFTGIAACEDHLCRCDARSRCSARARGGAALQGIVRRDWRNLGGPACAEFHRNKAFGNAGRSKQFTMLARQALQCSKPKCGARALAHCLTSFATASTRSQGPRFTPLAGRIVQVARANAGNMGRKP